jgi:hypothetical protein
MKESDYSTINPAVLSWNLRNTNENAFSSLKEDFCVVGTCLGEYPIDAWKNHFIEIPLHGRKRDLLGRSQHLSKNGLKNNEWNRRRTLHLPIYSQMEYYNEERMRMLIKHWYDIGIPDDVPCITLAIKCTGFYSDYREAQYITILTVCNDTAARIISFDWFEGPLEDCITPEWYVESTSLLNLNIAIEKMQKLYEGISWDGLSYSIYTIPSCLGNGLQGDMIDSSYDLWNPEWKYSEYPKMNEDLDSIFSMIIKIFFNDSKESERHG